MKKFFSKVLYYVFEQYGIAKMFGSAIIAAFFYWLYYKTGNDLFRKISIPFAVFLGLDFILQLIYAWIINPIRSLKERKKK